MRRGHLLVVMTGPRIASCALCCALIGWASRASAASPPIASPPEPSAEDEADEIVVAAGAPHLLDQPVSRAGISAFGGFTGGFGGQLGIAGYIELQRDTPGELSPSARVGFELAHGSTSAEVASPQPGSTYEQGIDVSRLAFRIDACPFRSVGAVRWSHDASSLALCARGDVGTVTATAFGTGNSLGVSTHNWIATGAIAQARWSSSRIFFGLEMGLSIPLVRDAYIFGPGARPYPMPPAVFTIALGGGAYVL